MPLFITELLLGDVNTIAIPTDAIWIISLLIIFALLGYFFNNILDDETKRLTQRTENNSNLELIKEKLEDQLTLSVTTLDQKNVEKPSMKKLNLFPSSKVLGLSSLAIMVMGGISLLGLESMQKSYKGVNSSQENIKLDHQSTKSLLSTIDIRRLDKTPVKKTAYFSPFLSTLNNSKFKRPYTVKKQQIENNFSF